MNLPVYHLCTYTDLNQVQTAYSSKFWREDKQPQMVFEYIYYAVNLFTSLIIIGDSPNISSF